MKVFVAVVVLVSAWSGAVAGQSAREVTSNVTETATAYAKAISCGTSDIGPMDVVALSPYTSFEDRDDAEYLIFWKGDVGCAGGSGTVTTNVTSVRIGTGDSYIVDLARSSPSVSVDVSSGAKLVGNSGNAVFFETYEYAEGDANCCPSVQKRAALTRDGAGSWVE